MSEQCHSSAFTVTANKNSNMQSKKRERMKEIESSISTFQTHHSIILTTGTTFHFEQAAGDDFTAGLTPYTKSICLFPHVSTSGNPSMYYTALPLSMFCTWSVCNTAMSWINVQHYTAPCVDHVVRGKLEKRRNEGKGELKLTRAETEEHNETWQQQRSSGLCKQPLTSQG